MSYDAEDEANSYYYGGKPSNGYRPRPLNGISADAHGANIVIMKVGDRIVHETREQTTKLLIRSYRNGIRIGCTFISDEAFSAICDMHLNYRTKDYTEHQEGSGA